MPHVTFIHGISNKPEKEKLLNIWRNTLKKQGLNLGVKGVSSSMVYWADVMYEKPDNDGTHESYLDKKGLKVSDVGVTIPNSKVEIEPWIKGQKVVTEQDFINALAHRLDYNQPSPNGDDNYSPEFEQKLSHESVAFERIPLPWFIKRRLMKVFLKDVHHYLFNVKSKPRDTVYKVRDEIRNRFIKAIAEGNKKSGPHIVISHSMGTVIAYDCLKRVPECESIDSFMTIGSPLGLDEVQDKLQPDNENDVGWTKKDGFPSLKVNDWVNIYDLFDPVAGFDAKLANDFKQNSKEIISDINEQNHGKWRHSIHKYLSQPKLISALSKMLNL